MSTLATLKEKDAHRPPSTLLVPPTAFAREWRDRPLDVECCGVRPLSEADVVFCRSEAVRLALAAHPISTDEDDPFEEERTACYNDALMRYGVARGTCDPNDALRPWAVWGMAGPDPVALDALCPEGVKFIWDAIERVTIETSPVTQQATDEEITELSEKAARALAAMPHGRAARLRRLLRFCLDDVLVALGEPRA